ncbi:MAG: hypothetical protein CMJ81_16800 [Planctomycetaceae bacterium]|nr:hypothetical protein [Planctomycetaceae bacterium]MBP63847.1 hypothetical protein [Planctomycetaceae bacterium]
MDDNRHIVRFCLCRFRRAMASSDLSAVCALEVNGRLSKPERKEQFTCGEETPLVDYLMNGLPLYAGMRIAVAAAEFRK